MSTLPEARPRAIEAASESGSAAMLPARFDLDAWHAMQRRDESLIAERVLNGVTGQIFVYSFKVSGKPVAGISVEGAHQLATVYGGIKHRIVASVEKKGPVFTFRSYPAVGIPMAVSVNVVPELADEADFYSCVVELTDVKTGNTFQAEASENRREQKSDGSWYERPNFTKIAQSKARRNGILMLIPGAVQEQFKQDCLKSGTAIDISADVFASKRAGILRYCASKGIAIQATALDTLTLSQISGLSDAVSESDAAFLAALASCGLTGAPSAAPPPPPPAAITEQREAPMPEVRAAPPPEPVPAQQQQQQPAPAQAAAPPPSPPEPPQEPRRRGAPPPTMFEGDA